VTQLLSTVFWQEVCEEPEEIAAVCVPAMKLCVPVLVQNSHVQTVLLQSAKICRTEKLLPTEKEKQCTLMIVGLFKEECQNDNEW
jgi:hypothetical protein